VLVLLLRLLIFCFLFRKLNLWIVGTDEHLLDLTGIAARAFLKSLSATVFVVLLNEYWQSKSRYQVSIDSF
jgi:hypothetical protein